ncbi:uncharacterized protein [Miscanthus floridulus]|uniref:uncharacterized protein n=1 Tax=Miscanthus floridulus TaxID=154761 RepID=UPI003459D12B
MKLFKGWNTLTEKREKQEPVRKLMETSGFFPYQDLGLMIFVAHSKPGHVAPKSLIGPAVSSSLFYWSTSAASFTWPSADHVARKTLATSPRNISRLPLQRDGSARRHAPAGQRHGRWPPPATTAHRRGCGHGAAPCRRPVCGPQVSSSSCGSY